MSQLKQNGNSGLKGIQQKFDIIEYTEEEHSIWEYLYNEQVENLKDKAIPKFFECLNSYHLPQNRIPQLSDVSNHLKKQTGWEIIGVEDLIDIKFFFQLLAYKKFPSTVYIRKKHELYISKDPDIFHELFGHVTMLLDQKHAYYMQSYGKIALTLNEIELKLLQRLFWFTYEVGLIQTKVGPKIYGGSILSSLKESNYALEKEMPYRKPFSLLEILRTPYRADQLQKSYYVLDDFQTLFNILENRAYLIEKIWQAYYSGEFPAQFPVDNSHYISVNCCEKVLLEKDLELEKLT